MTIDWNAKIGKDIDGWPEAIGRYRYGDRNECVERLLEFASPEGIHKNMIDLILIQRRWKTSVINCRSFQSPAISSDHSFVLCNIKLRLKKMNNIRPSNTKVDANQLWHEKTRQLYETTLAKNMHTIPSPCNLEEHSNKIASAIKNATESTISAKRTPKKP